MEIFLELTKIERDFFEFKMSILGQDRYLFELWRKWGLKLLNSQESFREIYFYLFLRSRNKHQLIYKYFYLNNFYYELFRTIAISIGIEIYELISFLIYKDMIGDDGFCENVSMNLRIA